MKFGSSTLFVNTGRKPLSGMKKTKKVNKNTIALGICIAIIAVLCIFVGSFVRLWFAYNEEATSGKPIANNEPQGENTVVVNSADEEKEEPKVHEEVQPTDEKEEKEEKPQTKDKESKTTSKDKNKGTKTKEKTKTKPTTNKTSGKTTELSKQLDTTFADVKGTYSYGVITLGDNYQYINNTDKITNSAALGAFLMEYASNGIYLGTFDYDVNVGGTMGRDVMTNAFMHGDVNAANALINHFGVDNLNAYFQSKGYENTKFGGTIGSGNGCYTTSEDLLKLMRKMYDNTGFFPYSDMYKKMRNNVVDDKIVKNLPEGTSVANITFTSGNETFDGGVVYTPAGNYIFVAMAGGTKNSVSTGSTAIAEGSKQIYDSMN